MAFSETSGQFADFLDTKANDLGRETELGTKLRGMAGMLRFGAVDMPRSLDLIKAFGLPDDVRDDLLAESMRLAMAACP